MGNDKPLDSIGPWSEVKLDILREYASAYSTVLLGQKARQLYHVYIDAFAGAGINISRATKELIPGSPLNALNVEPPFREYHFIDLDRDKVARLRELVGPQKNVFFYQEDCNKILLEVVFPRIHYEDYRRGLCILDPYGLHLNWEVVAKAGSMKSIEIFLNFPIMDMNRNVLWNVPDDVPPEQKKRMTAFWGDESWQEVAYGPSRQHHLFDDEVMEKQPGDAFASAYQSRLKEVAGFPYAPDPILFGHRNRGFYYLFFASHNRTGAKIAQAILKKYREKARL